MSNTNEEESLFSELGKFEELQSPFHLFPVLHRELESLNRLKRNREKSVLVSSVLSGLHPVSYTHLTLPTIQPV